MIYSEDAHGRGLRPPDPGWDPLRRYRGPRPAGRPRGAGRPDRGPRAALGRGAPDRRRPRPRRRAGLRRHPHPLRRPGVLGPGRLLLALARGDERRDRELRLRRRADPRRPPGPDPAHPRERRRHVPRRAACGARRRVALRELPRVPRRHRGPGRRDQRRRAGRPHAASHLRDGRGRGEARSDPGRGGGDAPPRPRSPRRGGPRLRHLEVAHPRRLRRQPGAEPRRVLRRDPGPRRDPRRGAPRRHAGDDRPGALLRRVRRHREAHREARVLDGAARRLLGAQGPPRHPRAPRQAPVGRDPRGAPGLVPAPRARVPVEGALSAREHGRDAPRVGRRLRRQEADLRRSGLPRGHARADRRRRPAQPRLRHGALRVRSRAGARGAQPRGPRRRARSAPGGPRPRSRSRHGARGALPPGGGQHRRGGRRRAAGASRRHARPLRRRRPREPALRRRRSYHPARQVGAGEAGALPRGGRAAADERARRGVRHQGPRAPRGGPRRGRHRVRPRHGRLRARAPGPRFPGRRRSAGGRRLGHPLRHRERNRDPRGRPRPARRRRRPPRPRAPGGTA